MGPQAARVWLVVAATLAGCAVDPSGLGFGDAPPGEADLGAEMGPLDGGSTDLGDRDGGPLDMQADDMGPLDMGPLDMGPLDMGPPPLCEPTEGLVGCYPFDGTAPFADRSGLGNDLVATAVTIGPGAIGDGAWLNAGSSLFAPDSPSLDPSDAFSVDLWLWVDAFPGSQRSGVLDKNGQFGIFIYPGGVLRCTGGGGAAEVTGLSASEWMHIGCTHDGSTIRLYVDGTERAAVSSGAPGGGNEALHLGEDSPDGDDQLAGRLDDVRLWTRTLPAERIAASAARR